MVNVWIAKLATAKIKKTVTLGKNKNRAGDLAKCTLDRRKKIRDGNQMRGSKLDEQHLRGHLGVEDDVIAQYNNTVG